MVTSLSSYHPTLLSSARKITFTLAEVFYPAGKSHKCAFTLAEVLITLGIIGVVAALTMPTLIGNQRKKEVETKLAKFYSVANQAVKLAANEYGDITELGPLTKCATALSETCSTDEAIEAFKGYFGKYIQYSKIEHNSDDTGFLVYLNDGTVWAVSQYIYDMQIYINSKAVENRQAGINFFHFRFSPVYNGSATTRNKYHYGKGIEPYVYDWDGTSDTLKSGSQYSCDSSYRVYCAKLIQMNGWKIPKDYPLKF